MKKSFLQKIAVTAAFLMAVSVSYAGDIHGYVMNPYNQPARGAQVQAWLNGNVVRTTSTRLDGSYSFLNLPASTSYYSVEAKLNGWYGNLWNCALFLPNVRYYYPARGCNVQLFKLAPLMSTPLRIVP
jgi:hypothetical protein